MRKRTDKHIENIDFKLKNLLKKKSYSKNRLARECNFRFETIQGYYNGTISRVDLFVLSEFCRVLDCKIADIIEYKPSK